MLTYLCNRSVSQIFEYYWENNIVNTELWTSYSAYCSQAANNKVTKKSKFLAFVAREKLKSAGARYDLPLQQVFTLMSLNSSSKPQIVATECSSSEWGHCTIPDISNRNLNTLDATFAIDDNKDDANNLFFNLWAWFWTSSIAKVTFIKCCDISPNSMKYCVIVMLPQYQR